MTDRPICCIEGCDRQVRCRAMCYPHYCRWLDGARGERLNRPVQAAGPIRTCELDDCDDEHYAVGLCRAHYRKEWKGHDPRTLKRKPGKGRAVPPPPLPPAD